MDNRLTLDQDHILRVKRRILCMDAQSRERWRNSLTRQMKTAEELIDFIGEIDGTNCTTDRRS